MKDRKIVVLGPHNINVSTRGGARPGAGRKKTEEKKTVTVNLSTTAIEILNTKKNKSKYINDLIIQAESSAAMPRH